MMSMGEEPGMSQAVRVRTSSQIGAVGRCPECIRAAMCASVVCVGVGARRVSRGTERWTGPGAGYDLSEFSVSPKVPREDFGGVRQAAAGRGTSETEDLSHL